MMKIFKYIAFPAILAATFACSKEQDTLYGPREEIRFDARTATQQTKSTVFPTTSEFGVTAFHTQGTAFYQYFGNVNVTYDSGSSKWHTASPLYWPRAVDGDGTRLEFRGYSPYAAESPWCTFPNSTTLSGDYSYAPGGSTDLMYSNPKAMSPATPSTVNLTFNHALGQTTYTLAVKRFDDSVEKGTYFGMEIYCSYPENDSSKPVEEKSFVFLSGNYPHKLGDGDLYPEYTPEEQAFDLKNPIQNIWYVEISNLTIHNLAWSGELEMTTADGSTWTKPANNVWSSPSERQSLSLLSESNPFYFSPNTKGFPMPFGTYFVLPQDLQPVISSQKPHIIIDISFMLFRAEDNAANDSAEAGDIRSRIFDYRDIAQYIAEGDITIDGSETKRSGVFKKWYSENAHRDFPNGTHLDFGTAVLRQDAKALLTVTKTIDLPLYDSKKSNPRYLMMNTNTTYSIIIDPAGQDITFSPTIDNWVEPAALNN